MVGTAPAFPDTTALTTELQRLEQLYGGHLGVAAKNLRTGEMIGYNAAERFPTASLIKLPVMAAFYKAVNEGRVDPATRITVTPADKKPGSGVLDMMDSGAVITLLDAVRLMIVLSDNTATNLVLDRLDATHDARLARVNTLMTALGLKNTRILNRLYSWETKQRTPEGVRYGIGVSTPEDMVILNEAIYRKTCVDAASSEAMLGILKTQFYDDAVPRFLPAGTCKTFAVAHKTGFVQETRTDAGLVLSDRLEMAIAVFVDKHPDHGSGLNNTGTLLAAYAARAVWNHFTGDRGYEPGPVRTDHVDWNMIPGGKWGIWRSTAALFPHPQRADGFTRPDGTRYPFFPHYADSSVVVFVPEGFRPTDEGANIIVHFHGHLNDNMNVLERYEMPQAIVDERTNALLVLAQGPYRARDSFGGTMEDPDGLRRLVDDVLATMVREKVLDDARPGRIILSAHSGGYRPVAYCLDRGGMNRRIDRLFLFDAFYGNFDSYKAWLAAGEGIIEAAYTDHLADEHTQFAASLDASTAARFRAERAATDHDGVVRAYLRPWLSRLPASWKIVQQH